MNRLLSFLRDYGGIELLEINKIKDHVYRVKMENDKIFALKCFPNRKKLEHQQQFFKQWKEADKFAAPSLPFPNGEWIITDKMGNWGLFEWINGHHLSFRSHHEREKAAEILAKFHISTEGIKNPLILREPLYLKWEKRLQEFEQTRPGFCYYGKEHLFEQMVKTTRKTLKDFRYQDWGRVEEDSWNRKAWNHGDVAHHNFIFTPEGKVKLIDFDLLHMGPELYDQIQLGQRFLPYTNHSRLEVLRYFQTVRWKKEWLKGMLVPCDLLREWLFIYRKRNMGSKELEACSEWLETAWEKRRLFVEKVQLML